MLMMAAITILPLSASAALECPVGQHVENVQTVAGTPEVPAYVEVIHHDAVTHTVHHNAKKEWGWSAHGWGWIITHPAYDEVVVDVPAYDESINHPAVPAVPATFEDQCVADTTPVVPTCTEAQHLEDNVCVDNTVTPPVDETPASSPAPTSNGGGGGNPGGRRHCDVVGTPTCENWVKGIMTPVITLDGGVAGSTGGQDWSALLDSIKTQLLHIMDLLKSPDFKG